LHEMRRPGLVVAMGRLGAVPTVDEHQREGVFQCLATVGDCR
jgi:hypothetical protein